MSIRKVSEKVGMTGSGEEDQGRMNDSQPTPCPMHEADISPPDLLAVTQQYYNEILYELILRIDCWLATTFY
ncbi:MAG TPA: hypothetical protein VGK10_16465 [Prolixibacteraceae bacterium]|jgi:hypothetical protein